MTYFKIIKNNLITDVACGFFKFQTPHYNIIQCGEDEAELLQSCNELTFYTTDWLKSLPKNIKKEEVVAVRISFEEYEEIKAQLDKEIPVAIEEEPILIIEEENQEEPQEDKVLTVAELYNKIALLEKEIRNLQKK